MAAWSQDPYWIQHDNNILVNYELPSRIHTAQLCPSSKPDSAQIIVFGHDEGLTVVWRRGHAVSSGQSEESSHAMTGSMNAHDAMNVDSNGTRSGDFLGSDSSDTGSPFNEIHHVREIHLDSPVLHLSMPKTGSDTSIIDLETSPILLDDHFIVALAHANSTARILAIPNDPDSEMEIQQLATNPLRADSVNVPRAIAATWSAHNLATLEEEEPDYTILFAVHSAVGGGQIEVSEVTLSADGRSLDSIRPCFVERVPKLLTGLDFSPARCLSEQHAQLLMADVSGVVRVFDCKPRSPAGAYRSGREARGSWILRLSPPSTDAANPQQAAGRRIVDVRWAFNGACIIILLSDGEWGLWDIQGIGPSGSSRPASFAIHGHLPLGMRASTVAKEEGETKAGKGLMASARETTKLAPMTPKTRKVKQDNLFAGSGGGSGGASGTKTSHGPVGIRGGICLSAITRDGREGDNTHDDALILWLSGSTFYIASLRQYWQKAVQRKAADAGTSLGHGMQRLNELTTFGERINSICQPTLHARSQSDGQLEHDIVIAAEHRLLILCAEKPVRLELRTADQNLLDAGRQDFERLVDQDLLSRGELDLGGMDRLMDSISSRPNGDSQMQFPSSRHRKVNFSESSDL